MNRTCYNIACLNRMNERNYIYIYLLYIQPKCRLHEGYYYILVLHRYRDYCSEQDTIKYDDICRPEGKKLVHNRYTNYEHIRKNEEEKFLRT